jgi:hypothetical protein
VEAVADLADLGAVDLVVAEVVEVGKLTSYKTFNKTSVLHTSRSFFIYSHAQVKDAKNM